MGAMDAVASPYRLLVCDLDGTLVGRDTSIAPRVTEALADVQARCIHVTLATGRGFLETLMDRGFEGPFVIENEADNSAHTGNLGATLQGFQAAVLCLAPIVWPLVSDVGYRLDNSKWPPLATPDTKDVPVRSMKDVT